eukprot:4128783-Pyramimonas_sp.AAC.1
MEEQLVSVRDTGAAAARALHDDILTLRRVFAGEVHGTMDHQIRDDFIALCDHFEVATAKFHSEGTITTSELHGKLCTAEMAKA